MTLPPPSPMALAGMLAVRAEHPGLSVSIAFLRFTIYFFTVTPLTPRAALFVGALAEGVLATAVKAMGADLALGQTDGLDHLLDAVEPQRGQP